MNTLVGKPAPHFRAKAVKEAEIIESFSLSEFKGKQSVLLFFYPKDFTFVCPTELHAFEEARTEFEKRNVALIACSTDTEFSHLAWLNTPRAQGGIQGIKYPIIADTNKTIASAFGVLAGQYYLDENRQLQADAECVAYRGLFFIDQSGIVRHSLVNAMPVGRSVEEALRTIDAWQHFEKHGEVCPANWQIGTRAFKPNAQETRAFLVQSN